MQYTLYPVCHNGNILHHCSLLLHPGSWYRYSPLALFRFHQFYMHVYFFPCGFITWADWHDYRHSQDTEQFFTSFLCYTCTSIATATSPSFLSSLTLSNVFSVSIILSFQECHINGIIVCNILRLAFFSLSIIPLRTRRMCINNAFLFYCWVVLYGVM